jgi:hypothetical protein
VIYAVGYKIAVPFKLELLVGLRVGELWLDDRGHHLQAVRVEAFQEVFAVRDGVCFDKHAVV